MDKAIAMYKRAKMYDQMVRLVTTYRKEKLPEAHTLIAQQLEVEGNLREAEKHFVEAKVRGGLGRVAGGGWGWRGAGSPFMIGFTACSLTQTRALLCALVCTHTHAAACPPAPLRPPGSTELYRAGLEERGTDVPAGQRLGGRAARGQGVWRRQCLQAGRVRLGPHAG